MMNDTDIEQREAESVGNAIARFERRGGCTHSWVTGSSPVTCRGCGATWATEQDHQEAFNRIIDEIA